MKRGEVAIYSNPGIATIECAAYGSPRPPLPLRDFGGNHDYELVDDGKAVHIQFNGIEEPDSDVYENEEGAYEIIPGEAH